MSRQPNEIIADSDKGIGLTSITNMLLMSTCVDIEFLEPSFQNTCRLAMIEMWDDAAAGKYRVLLSKIHQYQGIYVLCAMKSFWVIGIAICSHVLSEYS